MKMDDFDKPKIERVIFTFRYQLQQEIERLMFEFEKEFSLLFNKKKALLTRIPQEAPPEMPRFILQDGPHKILEASLIETRFSITPQNKRAEDIKGIVKPAIDDIFCYLNKHSMIKLEGFLCNASMRMRSKQNDKEIQNKIFKDFFIKELPPNLSNASFMYETVNGDFTLSQALGHYQNLSYTLKHNIMPNSHNEQDPTTLYIKMDPEYAIVTETGLALQIIIKNTKDIAESNIEKKYNEFVNNSLNTIKNSYTGLLS